VASGPFSQGPSVSQSQASFGSSGIIVLDSIGQSGVKVSTLCDDSEDIRDSLGIGENVPLMLSLDDPSKQKYEATLEAGTIQLCFFGFFAEDYVR
jgi:hypothetical protein